MRDTLPYHSKEEVTERKPDIFFFPKEDKKNSLYISIVDFVTSTYEHVQALKCDDKSTHPIHLLTGEIHKPCYS